MAKPKLLTVKTCKVCQHPERLRIEMLRLAGSTGDHLAATFGLHRDSIYRHMKSHVSDEQKAALIVDVPMSELAERAAREGGSLLDHLSLVRETVMRRLLGAAAIDDSAATASLARAATDVLDKIGRLTGELVNAAGSVSITNNIAIMQSPAFARVQAMLVEALRPHPEALQAVLSGFEALEDAEDAAPASMPPMGRVGPPVIEGEAFHAA